MSASLIGLNNERMLAFNRELLLFHLFRLKQASISELAKNMSLSVAAVSKIVKALISEKKLILKEPNYKGRGKKAGIVCFSDAQDIIICIDVRPDSLHSVLSDLFGQIKSDLYSQNITANSKEELLHIIAEHIKHYTLSPEYQGHKFKVAIAMHGQVDSTYGISLFMPQANYHEPIYIKYHLEQKLKLEVLVDNDCVMRALAQKWFLLRHKKELFDFCIINLDYGIGSSFLINQEIYRGNLFGSGQIGHTIIDPNGAKCACGQNGCLETIASTQAIQHKVNLALNSFYGLYKEQKIKLNFNDIVKLYLDGNEIVRSQVNHSAINIGCAIYNLLNILNINHIYLYGASCQFGQDFLAIIKKESTKNPFDHQDQIKLLATTIEYGKLSLSEQIAGIGYIFGEQLFK